MPTEEDSKIEEESPKRSKVFTQADVDRIVGQRVAEATKKFAPLQAELEQHRTVNEAAKGRVSELEAQLAALAGERDTAKSALEASRAEHAGLAAKHTQAVAEHKAFRVEHALTHAFVAARVLPSATRFAIHSIQRDAQIEMSDAGEILSVTFEGTKYAKAEEAAEAYLTKHDFLALAPAARGTGSKPPNAGGLHHGSSQLVKDDPIALAERGWSEKP